MTDTTNNSATDNCGGFITRTVTINGQEVVQVTTPKGQSIQLVGDERLLVVNGVPEFVVDSSENAFTAMRQCALDHGITTFRLTDERRNRKIVTNADIQLDSPILFIQVTPVARP